MGWPASGAYFVNTNASLLPPCEPLGPQQKPSSALPHLAHKCMQPTGPCSDLEDMKLSSPTFKHGPLPQVKTAALSWREGNWVLAVLGEHWHQEGLQAVHHSGWHDFSFSGNIANHTEDIKKGKKTATHCFGYTQHLIHFQPQHKGLVQNNAMIEFSGLKTHSTPIVHVRTAH